MIHDEIGRSRIIIDGVPSREQPNLVVAPVGVVEEVQ